MRRHDRRQARRRGRLCRTQRENCPCRGVDLRRRYVNRTRFGRHFQLRKGEGFMLERLEQQKKLTANQWRIIATANLGDMLDFFDFFLIGYVLAFILKDWHITYGQSAVILISAGLGAVPGAFFWGWMGDRIGRRKVFMMTALNVALATGIMYFTPQQGGWIAGWIFLSFFRFFVGFGNAG